MVIIIAAVSLFCINRLGYLLEGRGVGGGRTKCKQQMCGKRVTGGKQRGEEQFMEYTSNFRCKTNSVT